MKFFFFKQKTAYEMRISDWSSDVCSSDLATHLRSEGDRFLESVDEALSIGRAARVPVHFYHLKVGGRDNWPKMAIAIDRIETARRAGQAVSADVYPYIAAGTGLDASMPPWLFDGGMEAGIARLDDHATRQIGRASCRARVCRYV